MNSFIIIVLGKPTARITAISLTYSNRFPVMEDEREKKQMNIVTPITTLKIISRVPSACKKIKS